MQSQHGIFSNLFGTKAYDQQSLFKSYRPAFDEPYPRFEANLFTKNYIIDPLFLYTNPSQVDNAFAANNNYMKFMNTRKYLTERNKLKRAA